jgi:hypothetical protein
MPMMPGGMPPPPLGMPVPTQSQNLYDYNDPNIRVDLERGGIHAGNVYIPPKDEGYVSPFDVCQYTSAR